MIEKLAENLVNLKKEFVSNYIGTSQIQELIPTSNSESFPIDQSELNLLHEYATKNPIYYNSFEKIIAGISSINFNLYSRLFDYHCCQSYSLPQQDYLVLSSQIFFY